MHDLQSSSLIHLIKKHLREKDYRSAKLVAEHLAARHPEIVDSWLYLAVLSSPEDRMTYLSKAQQIAPQDPRLVTALAWASRQMEDKRPDPVRELSEKRLIETRSIYFWLSIALAVIGIGLIVLLLVIWFYPQKPQASVAEDTSARFQPTHAQTATSTSRPEPTAISPTQTVVTSPSPTPTFTPSPTPTPEWMTYAGIDLRDQEIEALIIMTCGDDQIYLNPFFVKPYTPELFDSGEFNYNLDFSMAWDHLGFFGLWIHSGQSQELGDLPAFPLQLYLENDERGYRRSLKDFNTHLQTCLIGGELRLRQGDILSLSEVVAAVRIPPTEVDEVSRHPMDLVPYLAENYPDSGFDRMELPGLLFYFCGRQLSGEAYNDDHDYWTQSRIIIGFMPISGD